MCGMHVLQKNSMKEGGMKKIKEKKNNNNDLCNINNQCGNVFDNNTDRYF